MTAGRGGRALLGLAAVVVLAAVIAGLFVLGPPSVQRMKRLDAARINNLMTLDRTIIGYFKIKQNLPPTLAALSGESGYQVMPKDPETGVLYEYELTGTDTYRLCATFSTDNTSDSAAEDANSAGWAHRAGPQCFDRRASREQ